MIHSTQLGKQISEPQTERCSCDHPRLGFLVGFGSTGFLGRRCGGIFGFAATGGGGATALLRSWLAAGRSRLAAGRSRLATGRSRLAAFRSRLAAFRSGLAALLGRLATAIVAAKQPASVSRARTGKHERANDQHSKQISHHGCPPQVTIRIETSQTRTRSFRARKVQNTMHCMRNIGSLRWLNRSK